MQKKILVTIIAGAMGLGLAGCGDSSSDSDVSSPQNDPVAELLGSLEVPDTYEFESRFVSGAESALYSGQVTRQVLIDDLNRIIASNLRAAKESGTVNTLEEFLAELNAYYQDGTTVIGKEPLLLTTTPPTAQNTYNDISSGKNLVGKIAGNDDITDHKDWDNGGFQGWTAASPDALVQEWFTVIAANAASGETRMDPVNGTETLKDYHTEDGLDLKQMVQKFLLGAIPFSQGADDYLDDATDGKGLLTDNFDAVSGKPYTQLEHQFDEGFGYFGAARDYLAYTDKEIAGKGGREGWSDGYHDSNGDGEIDLNAEFNFGNSTNAAKRDLGSTTGTDFTQQAMKAFLTGRTIIARAGDDGEGDLTEVEMQVLKAQRDLAVDAWEKAVAATVVHYINDTLGDMDKADADITSYSYLAHTKHWAEMKAFALGLQFNPRSPLNEGSRFADFHDLAGERPALPLPDADEAFAAYRDDLLAARDLMQEAYGFDQADVENW
ncbi:DUF4856 domain-containing protein [Marinobacter sp.]|uniref:DUF4856 domain-containing protein n=1 Tax=Marinobacter sp. TaxID=50741 RepID=UPI00384E16A4